MNKNERQNKIFKTIADFSAEWIFYYSGDGIIEYVSPSVTEITGYEAEDFTARPSLLEEIIHPEDRKNVIHKFQQERYR
ncbi:MAG: PAS domain-containing protein [Spirochaetota bacterium]|nr:PAS domain-containing protein [Spirochaetota bacterium]